MSANNISVIEVKGTSMSHNPSTQVPSTYDRAMVAGQEVSPGVYMAVVDIEMNSGKLVQVSGDVLVLR